MEEDSTQRKMLKALDIDDIHRSALHFLLPENLSFLALQPTGVSVLAINCKLAAMCQDFCLATMRNVGHG